MNRFSRFISCAILAATSIISNAAEWPSQPVKIILPYPPGGASDVTARLLGNKLSQAWGQPVVIENRPGGNGIAANQLVKKSAADGYTILMANLGPNGINPAVYAKLPNNTSIIIFENPAESFPSLFLKLYPVNEE